MLSSRSFIVSHLVFKPLSHFEFIFVYGVRECSNFIFFNFKKQFILKKQPIWPRINNFSLWYHLLISIITDLLRKRGTPFISTWYPKYFTRLFVSFMPVNLLPQGYSHSSSPPWVVWFCCCCCYWVVWAVCIFWKLSPVGHIICKYFHLVHWFSFRSVYGFLCSAKSNRFD